MIEINPAAKEVPKEDVVRFTYIPPYWASEVSEPEGYPLHYSKTSVLMDNMRLTFCAQTGKLKQAEVI